MKNVTGFRWYAHFYTTLAIGVVALALVTYYYMDSFFAKNPYYRYLVKDNDNLYLGLTVGGILLVIGGIYFLLHILKGKINKKNTNFLLWVSKVLAWIISLSVLFLIGFKFVTAKPIKTPVKAVPITVKRVIEAPTEIAQTKDFNYTEQDIEKAINQFRLNNGKTELPIYDPLCDLAKIRAYEIRGNWSHEGFENRGVITGDATSFTKYCSQGKVECSNIGENLAKNYPTAQDVITGWENSTEGHRENMLGDYNVQCVAVIEGHVVSLFATVNEIPQQQTSGIKLTDYVSYDFEKVKYWENRKNEDEVFKINWEGAKNNSDYPSELVDKLLDTINKSIDQAEYIWDGYTNSKFTYKQAVEAENNYIVIRNQAADITKLLNQAAFDNCNDYWDKVYDETENEQAKEQKENCTRYIDQ